MIADGYLVGDGSWELRINVTDLSVERILRVTGNLHVGGVMLKLVEDLDIAVDWSDHGLWWPARNRWLNKPRQTLEQAGVQADAILCFTPIHKTLHIQLPDLRYMDCRVNFGCPVFSTVLQVCENLGMRHGEELSFSRQITQDMLKRNFTSVPKLMTASNGTLNGSRNDSSGGSNSTINSNHNLSSNSLDKSLGTNTPHLPGTPVMPPVNTGTWKKGMTNYSPYNDGISTTFSPYSQNSLSCDSGLNEGLDLSLSSSPRPSEEARSGLLKPKSILEKARMNVAWLDSSLSLMEQGINEFDTVLLRFKYYSFYDLNPKYDAVRINQVYEQARWAILSEEIDCTEEEMLMFAALQLQVMMQANVPQPNDSQGEDDIDAALSDLQETLEGSKLADSPGHITQVPELADYLYMMKPRKMTLKRYKKYYFTFRDAHLSLYKSRETSNGAPSQHYNLRGCEVKPEVNLSMSKYCIKLNVPTSEGMMEMWLKCETENQYAKWMGGCRLASKGRTMADSTYDTEVKSILAFLSMQHPAPAPVITPSQVDINPDDFIAPRILRKVKGKNINTKILEAHANVKDMNLIEAKMSFIKAWQALPDYGISLFIVKFIGQKREELLGVAFNRLMRMDLNTGNHLKTWRFNTMSTWNVNWEVRQMLIQFEEEKIAFGVMSSSCKAVHEFIGGYIFLSMRSKEQNQSLNEELFCKLTGGWI